MWLDVLQHASTYDEFEEAALQLDNLLGLDLWRNNATSRHYDWRLIHERLAIIAGARESGDINVLVNLLRSGLVRNLGNITAAKLYNRSFAGTKMLIEEYVMQVADAIEDISSLPASAGAGDGLAVLGPTADGSKPATNHDHGRTGRTGRTGRISGFVGAGTTLSTQMKLDFVHDTRQAFGRSTLVLQGGAIFGLCHLGVVKALFLRGLLPRIITGTATGALIASLVSVHTEEELPGVLCGEGIDLSAFERKGGSQVVAEAGESVWQSFWARWKTLVRTFRRFGKDGYLLDVRVLEECVRANVGHVTFEEAYHRSGRVLNITVAAAGQGGVPTLLNYVTAPNVLIWTAAVASNANTSSFYGAGSTTVLCKDPDGNIRPWLPGNVDFRHWTHVSYPDGESPLLRIAELFNVNHFIVSQARPYLIPFLQSDMHGPSLVETRNRTTSVAAFLARMVGLELRHRLRQLDTLQLLPAGIRRFLVDERVPAASMTLVPEVTLTDFVRLLERPTKETLDYWILRGERSVWPAVAALKVRCAIETVLDRAYHQARSLRAAGLRRKKQCDRRARTLAEGDRRDRACTSGDCS